MASFAKGKHAYGISDRSGFRYPLHRLRKEWNGALVGFDEWDAKQPQLETRRKIVDAQALKDPRPDRPEGFAVDVGVATVENPTGAIIAIVGQTGNVTVVT